MSSPGAAGGLSSSSEIPLYPRRFPVHPRPIRQFMPSLSAAASGMSTQMSFLEVIASNIANAETTQTPEGGPYQRKVAVVAPGAGGAGPEGVGVVTDGREGRLVYDPGHPDANEDGFVRYPNVDISTEMVDLMIARRLYEANASAFQAGKAMLKRALEI